MDKLASTVAYCIFFAIIKFAWHHEYSNATFFAVVLNSTSSPLFPSLVLNCREHLVSQIERFGSHLSYSNTSWHFLKASFLAVDKGFFNPSHNILASIYPSHCTLTTWNVEAFHKQEACSEIIWLKSFHHLLNQSFWMHPFLLSPCFWMMLSAQIWWCARDLPRL